MLRSSFSNIHRRWITTTTVMILVSFILFVMYHDGVNGEAIPNAYDKDVDETYQQDSQERLLGGHLCGYSDAASMIAGGCFIPRYPGGYVPIEEIRRISQL